MSDKPISVGDLVMVVRGRRCGCASPSDGVVFRVTGIRRPPSGYARCGHRNYAGLAADSIGDHFVELCRLKRIPPLDELEDVKRDEEITA